MTSPSIRRALLIRCGLGIGVLSAVLAAGVYLLVRESLYSELDDSIRETASILANQVELEDEAITYEWQEGLGTNQSLIEGALFQFWDETNGTTTRSPALRRRDLPRFSGVDGAPLLRGIQLSDGHHARAIGLRIYPFVLDDEKQAMAERGNIIDPQTLPQILVVARDAESVHRSLGRLRWILGAGCLLTLGLGFVLIERAIRSSLLPIHQLASQVQERAEHQLDEALELPEALPSELTGLATHFNLLLERVAAIRRRERDFIRHAAHELRTPIAGLRATTDLALSQPRDAAAYAAHLVTCQTTAAELSELVKRLSALARIGQPAAPASRETVDLAKLLRERAATFIERIRERKLELKDDINNAPLLATADPALVKIIFNNLLDNAVSYASGGVILLSANLTTRGVEVSMTNPSCDLKDEPERLFEPLFREESSRHDAASHLGIGLTLSRDAAHAMGGMLVADAGSDWIRFTLVLPRAME
ncbi:HAMP domain-containing protein [Luteolibacter flavescens]|uniref:histidine kinase n=1 Tax=Luteolibacter flavescens TaxID=1859460 RepID=A0ABT3FLA1_9BACT|nr:ATP-binding protein [Luteolibacter flavescens]MCW1884338.1 HAMP domain-containing protein [Luteolibacter flavescens]